MTCQRGHSRDRTSLWAALRDCGPLAAGSERRDALWLAVRDTVCTRGMATVVPFGSTATILVGSEYATDQLLAAMSWLRDHEQQARQLGPDALFAALRAVATRSAAGSGRNAQSDSLHGMTHVPPGCGLKWQPVDDWGVA